MKDAPATQQAQAAGHSQPHALPHGPWEDSFRLPPQAQPLHYLLTLRPDLATGTFSGDVVISVAVTAPLPYLAVHAKNLEVLATNVTRDDDDEAHGKEGGGESSSAIATSKFQPTYARQAFPCFDEPSFKSRFSIRLVRPSSDGYGALSNMNVEKEVPDVPSPGQTTVYFKESVPMVTYLACFIVSDFQSSKSVTISPGGFPLTVYSRPSQVAKTEYARDIAATITQFYIEYFGIDYPLPKLDLIAIPDFVSGAMEHWGLVTFRETALLFDPRENSAINKQRVATVIGHELAHMWFGNLMTLKWWDDLWLNEGFASYIEYKGVNSMHPDWAMMDQFAVIDLNPVLILDAAVSSHPIVQKVGHPDEITELFDTISYNKGASVIRMLEGFMGEELFRRGISSFLQKFKYKNAETKDLWDVLQETMDTSVGGKSPVNITHVMDTWTRQKGFPVLTVIIDDAGNRVLTQQRFLADPDADTSNDVSPYGYRWEVPITYTTSETSEIQSTWLHSEDSNVKVNTSDNVEWIKFNHRQVGYYRVNYTELEWQTFSSLLQGNVAALDAADRANLLDDAFSLADAGLLRYEIALEGTRYLRQETEYIPWHVATSKFKKLLRLLHGSLAYSDTRSYVRNLVGDVQNSVKWTVAETDNHLKKLLRIKVLDLACAAGLDECLDEAGRLFTQWLSKPENKPHPDLRVLVYSYGMIKGGTEKYWDLMWQLYLKEEDASEKTKLMEGLASAREPWLLQRFIELAKDESNVRSQDFFSVLSSISSNPIGSSIVWDFVRSEWEYLVDRFTLNDRYLGRLIPVVTKSFTSQLKKEEMVAFFERYPEAGAGKAARNQALETVTNNIHWVQTHKDNIGKWLSHQVSKSIPVNMQVRSICFYKTNFAKLEFVKTESLFCLPTSYQINALFYLKTKLIFIKL
ncbi:Aminopeptidase N, partial [Gryllus bimaculatus]